MLAQVKKIAGGDLAGRFGAWWNGREYTPPATEEAAADAAGQPPETAAEAADETPVEDVADAPEADAIAEAPVALGKPVAVTPTFAKPSSMQVLDGGAVRIRALEALWGEGRFSPGSFALDTRIADAALELADRPGDIGFIGADAALLNTFVAQTDRKPLANEWRAACLARVGSLVPSASLSACEVDRPRSFADGSLPAVVSVEAFAYADHKAGLVGRVFRALDDQGRWAFLDTTRRTKKAPAQAYASAWAEPQLATNDEIEELLTLAGFKTVRRVSVTEQMLAAAKQGYATLSRTLERAGAEGLGGREGALLLQELAWEAQSWRARMRALEGGALEMNLWVADKTVQEGPLDLSLDAVIRPDDAGAADALFDQA